MKINAKVEFKFHYYDIVVDNSEVFTDYITIECNYANDIMQLAIDEFFRQHYNGTQKDVLISEVKLLYVMYIQENIKIEKLDIINTDIP